MSQPSPTRRALYLEVEGIGPVFGVLHAHDAEAAGEGGRQARSHPERAVLICPPFGWEETCSYRARRDWADHLALAGYPALRVDLPGAGDSCGSPNDPERLRAWSATIRSAAEWLGDATGGARLAAIGIGLGGLLACRALAEGAPIDELVLWATPSRGRSFVRELRAFGRMEASKALDGGEQPPAIDQGSIGVGGFVLSAQTVRELEDLDVEAFASAERRPRRALLLERDGIAAEARLQRVLQGSGAAVTVMPAVGYGEMMAPPHEARSPAEVFAHTLAWLAEEPVDDDGAAAAPIEPAAAAALAPRSTPTRAHARFTEQHEQREQHEQPEQHERHEQHEQDAIELTVAGARISETPIAIEQPFGALFGVLAEPVGTPARELGAVLLNAGAHRRIGQGRMWVDAARRWAAKGVPTLRLDLEGIGDADGDAARLKQLGELYTTELVEQVLAALDALDERELGPSYVLAGLCSGAYWSFHAALRDERVCAAFMLNPQTLFWDPSLHTARVLRRGSRAKVLRGEVPIGKLVSTASGIPPLIGRRLLAKLRERRQGGDELDHALDQLRDKGKRVRFIFSGPEPLREEFERQGRIERATRWPNLGFDFVPGNDHILRPIGSQRLAHEALDRALERELALLADADADAGAGQPDAAQPGTGARVAINAFKSYE